MTDSSVSNFEYEEELEKVLRELEVNEDEIDWGISEKTAELYSTLGIREVDWLGKMGKLVTKWVAVGNHGIYLFKRRKPGEEPVVGIVSDAVIRSSKVVRVRGLDWYYLVDINGEKIVGNVSGIIRYIKKHYGIRHDAKFAVAALIAHMAKREKESLLDFRDFLLSLQRREFTVEIDDRLVKLSFMVKNNGYAFSLYVFLYELVSGKVKRYMAEICEEGYYTDTKTLYNIYVKWCNNKNIYPLTESQFTIEMERIGFKRVEIRGQSYYKDIGLV